MQPKSVAPPYSLNRWGYLVNFWAGSTIRCLRGHFWIFISDRKYWPFFSFSKKHLFYRSARNRRCAGTKTGGKWKVRMIFHGICVSWIRLISKTHIDFIRSRKSFKEGLERLVRDVRRIGPSRQSRCNWKIGKWRRRQKLLIRNHIPNDDGPAISQP